MSEPTGLVKAPKGRNKNVKRTSGSYARSRGNGGERELVLFIKSFGFNAERSQQFCGNSGDADIRTNIPNIYVECKRRKEFVGEAEIVKWLDKADDEKSINDLSVVFYREDYKPWYCYFRLDLPIGDTLLHKPVVRVLASEFMGRLVAAYSCIKCGMLRLPVTKNSLLCELCQHCEAMKE
jgi:hypothetical protein